MMEHELKTLPLYFGQVKSRVKNFEVRKADRDFQVGDTLLLREFSNLSDREYYTGRKIKRVITYILDGGQFGIKKGYVVLGIK